MDAFKRGQADAAANKGHPPRSDFGSNAEHQNYLKGRNGK